MEGVTFNGADTQSEDGGQNKMIKRQPDSRNEQVSG